MRLNTPITGIWKPGSIVMQTDRHCEGVSAVVRADRSRITISQSFPGTHSIYYSVAGDTIVWDEWDWRLRRRMRVAGLKGAAPKIVGAGEHVIFDGRLLTIHGSNYTAPAIQHGLTMDEARDGFRDVWLRSVEQMYVQDGKGPITLLLSGGVDSIAVLWALKEIGADVHAISSGRTEEDFDPAWAKKAANHFGVPWSLVPLPDNDVDLEQLLTEAIAVIEQTSFSNVLMAVCCVQLKKWCEDNGRPVAWQGYYGDLLFGHKNQTTGSFGKLPKDEQTAEAWAAKRIAHSWHLIPNTLQLAKNFRKGGMATWRSPFFHPDVASYAFSLPLACAPPVMNKPLLYGLLERYMPDDVCAWQVKQKIGFYTGAGVGKMRLENPILQDDNMRRLYQNAKRLLT